VAMNARGEARDAEDATLNGVEAASLPLLPGAGVVRGDREDKSHMPPRAFDALSPPVLPEDDAAAFARGRERRNRALIGLFACVDLVTNLAESAPFPFLPRLLEDSGCSAMQRGLVFAALPLGVLVTSPLVPRVVWRVGPLPILVGSLFALAACLLWSLTAGPYDACAVDGGAFVALPPCDPSAARRTTAVWALSRLVMGIGEAFVNVTCLCLITRHMPESMARANGVLESAIGVGYMAGPAVGGWLYEVGKSPALPTAAVAATVATLIPVVAFVLHREDAGEVKDPRRVDGGGDGDSRDPEALRSGGGGVEVDTRRVVARPLFLAAALVLFALSVSLGVFPSTLSPEWERSLGMDEGEVGSAYAGISALYAVFTLAVGPVAEDGPPGTLAWIAAGGMLSCAFGHVCFAAAWPLAMGPFSAWREGGWRGWTLRVLVGGAAYGVGSAFAFVPLLPLMQESVADLGPEYAEYVAGLFNGCYYLGELVGQLLGAQAVKTMGFDAFSTAIAGLMVGSCALFLGTRAAVGPDQNPPLLSAIRADASRRDRVKAETVAAAAELVSIDIEGNRGEESAPGGGGAYGSTDARIRRWTSRRGGSGRRRGEG
jgi:predicted MFS family arabinose efflux permease